MTHVMGDGNFPPRLTNATYATYIPAMTTSAGP